MDRLLALPLLAVALAAIFGKGALQKIAAGLMVAVVVAFVIVVVFGPLVLAR